MQNPRSSNRFRRIWERELGALVVNRVHPGLLFFATPSLFPYLMSEPAVIAVGVPYVQVRMLGIAATGVNFVFRGYWNGVNLSKVATQSVSVYAGPRPAPSRKTLRGFRKRRHGGWDAPPGYGQEAKPRRRGNE